MRNGKFLRGGVVGKKISDIFFWGMDDFLGGYIFILYKDYYCSIWCGSAFSNTKNERNW